jgi:spermidine synthase
MSQTLTPPSLFTEVFESEGSAIGLQIEAMLHEEQSPYQKITIYKTSHFGNLMVLDGCIMLTQRENFIYHEMMSHPALFSHPKPESVVVIGGGDCGTLKEVLKHPDVKSALQVEIDERVTVLSQQYFPELCESNNDPRAQFYFGDGIQWVKDTAKESIDLIIIDSTDPVGPAEGLFAVDFYRNCFQALKPGGMIVQQSESPLFHSDSIIKKMRADLLQAGFAQTVVRAFAQPVYPSGWWSCTLGIKGPQGSVDYKKPLRARTFSTRYYTEQIHEGSTYLPAFMTANP